MKYFLILATLLTSNLFVFPIKTAQADIEIGCLYNVYRTLSSTRNRCYIDDGPIASDNILGANRIENIKLYMSVEYLGWQCGTDPLEEWRGWISSLTSIEGIHPFAGYMSRTTSHTWGCYDSQGYWTSNSRFNAKVTASFSYKIRYADGTLGVWTLYKRVIHGWTPWTQYNVPPAYIESVY